MLFVDPTKIGHKLPFCGSRTRCKLDEREVAGGELVITSTAPYLGISYDPSLATKKSGARAAP